MNSKWHFRKKQIDNSLPFKNIAWIIDKDNRATLIWLSTLLGGAFIVFYYFSLGDGFTPSISIAQAGLIFIQAAFLGCAIIIAFCLGTFSPAFVYRICGIDIDLFTGKNRILAIRSLAIRSIFAQAIGTFITFSIAWYLGTNNNLKHIFLAGVIFLTLVLIAILFHIMPTLTKFGFKEEQSTYRKTIFGLALSAAVSLLFIFTLTHLNSTNELSDWQSPAIWILVVLYGALFGTLPRSDWKIAAFGMITLVCFFLFFVNGAEKPLRIIANTIGIAESHRVTLVLPNQSCIQIKQVIRNDQLECSGPYGGLLTNVDVRSSWGDRWDIRVGDDTESIIFDGKGVLIKKEKPVIKKNGGSNTPLSPLNDQKL